ncbi:excisionase [Vagococcus lutrae]|uniref:excisionase n=1 Tax=Vagococcus lutrae TaxID=81947 RepID=UPI001926A9F1|nr:excisionase [Vagococcus lutrae]UQF11466.1 excisionase family DNA-binding protein [Vagococcus lutrae]UQF71625.1 excisionase family DNA-binding protein [Vagococcus lutrae]GEQ61651.1 transposase [Vagococcus lutrae]GEQ63220.1 transposase [Vagococcus lutrae]GEQ65112.1 transposase [Vagococcus lutrae]
MDRENINDIRIAEKAFLTLKEAASYFNIGQDKIRQLTDERDCTFVLFNGNKRLIKRELMEGYLNKQYSI